MRFLKRLLLTGCLLSCFGCLGSIVFSQAGIAWLKAQLIEPNPLPLEPVGPTKDLALLNAQMTSGKKMQLSAEELEAIIWEHSKTHLVALNVELIDGDVVLTGSAKAEHPDGFFNFKLSATPQTSLEGDIEIMPLHCTIGTVNLYILCQALKSRALGFNTSSLFTEISVQDQQLSVTFNPSQVTQLLSVVDSDLTIQNLE